MVILANVQRILHKEKKYDPTKTGLTYATYIHGEQLTGILRFTDTILTPFTWELNSAALGNKSFWSRVKLTKNINGQINVGWKGSAIRLSDAKKHIPSKITHYGTYWDDYGMFRYRDYLNLK